MNTESFSPEELATYATLADIEGISESVVVVQERVADLWGRFDYNSHCINDTISTFSQHLAEEVGQLRTETELMKEALIEVQDSLRQLGMDDMTKRLGDINLLLN